VLGLLWALVTGVPIGTNLGLVMRLWMLVSGRRLGSRGAVIRGLAGAGLEAGAVRRAWAGLGQGDWTAASLLGRGRWSRRPWR